MTQQQGNSGGNVPQLQTSSGRMTPARVAAAMSVYGRALVIICFWAVVGSVAVGAVVLTVRLVWWACTLILNAVGV